MTDPGPTHPVIPGLHPQDEWRTAEDDPQLDYGDIPVPTAWQTISADDAAKEWDQLRRWVEDLQDRFEHLDHHALPRCWWRHNSHVEALVALRDHERSSFADTAPATAPLDWFRALRDITALLRTWTAELGCGATHQPPAQPLRPADTDAWDRFVTDDVNRRRNRQPATTEATDTETATDHDDGGAPGTDRGDRAG
jgi:hypothetical protein